MRYKKVRKLILRQHKQAISLSHQAEDSFEELVINRFGRLAVVRRFVAAWLIFWVLLALISSWQIINLSSYYQTIKPVPGGIYNEGILGTLNNVNPIYATNEVDTSLSKLIFASLFTYNSQNKLVGELASGYSINKAGTTYTVNLKPNLTWQDGKPLTASDVVFTIRTIQNPLAQSPLYSSWQGISVSALNSSTVIFKLPNPLASFPYNLTVGILPKHILGSLNAVDLRAASFNTYHPIGSGPFLWHAIAVSGNTPENASETIALLPFNKFVLGKPKLAEFIVHAYANQQQLIAAFNANQLSAVAGLDYIPKQLAITPSVQIHSQLLTAGTYVFFKTSSGILSDVKLRNALVLAANPKAIIDHLGYKTIPVNEPLLIGQLAYNPKYAQQTDNLALAKQILNSDGWIMSKNGYRYKNHQELSFNIVTTNTPENRLVVGILKSQWRTVGAYLKPIFESVSTYTTTLQDHNYNSTLDGISIGVDPDVFVYWDKSQFRPKSTGLNLSEYDSAGASSSLEAGRTRLNPALRVIKYQPFLADWQKDAPALGLYQPRTIYITRETIYGMNYSVINSSKDRFNNVQNWEILTANVTDKRP